jgi:general stress protein CsbA
MVTAPLGVIHHQLNLTGQNVLTFVSWALTFVLLGVTIQLGRRERTPFYVLIVVVSMVGAFAEALYDEAFSLYFYSTHGMQSFYTAFDVPQPVWTHSGYAVLYALPAVLISYRIRNDQLTRNALYAWAGVEFGMSCVFEMTGINIGTYTYWGPHVFRVFHYPLAVGVLEAAQTICFAVAASQLRRRTTSSWGLLGLFVVFPATFFGANFGAGSAVIIAIHAWHPSRLAVYPCTLLSILFAITLIRFAAALLPKPIPSASGPLSSGNAVPGSLEGALG